MKNMILLRSLRLNNFISHEDTTIQFGDSQKLLIDGNSGGGKSAVLESIIWALYGLGRTDNRSLVRHGSKKATVVLTLGDGEHTYEIERSIASAGKHTLVVRVDGVAHPETRVRELQSWIENDLIGASYLLFVNSIAYLQGGADTFVTQNASRRKELLLEIVKTGDFDAYYERVKALMGEIELSLAESNTKAISINKWLDEAAVVISTKGGAETAIAGLRTDIEGLLTRQSDIMRKLAIHKQARGDATEAARVASELRQDLNDLHAEMVTILEAEEKLKSLSVHLAERAEIEKKMTDVRGDIAVREEEYQKHIDNQKKRNEHLLLKPTVNDYSRVLSSLDAQMKGLINSGKCPAGDACPHEVSRVIRTPQIDKEILDITQMMSTERQAYQAWETAYGLIPPDTMSSSEIKLLEEARAALVLLANKKASIDSILAQEPSLLLTVGKRTSIEQKIAQKDESYRTAITRKIELDALVDTSAIALLEKDKQDIEQEIAGKRSFENKEIGKLAVIESYESQRPSKMTELDAVMDKIVKAEENRSKLSLLREAFGSKGIKTVVLDWLLPALEDKINEILSQMSDFRVHLDTQQVKADGEGNKEGLFITIINEMGNEMSFDSYSGGEKLKIVVAISEALATLQKAGFRLMDEVFAGLDENATESFVQVLERLQARFSQVVCISHLQQIKDLFEQHLMVTKNNGISYVTE